MELRRQIAMFLKNEPGVLARVCRALAEKKVNILGISVQDAVDHAVVRMVTSDPRKAVHIVGEAGVLAIESDVIALRLSNRPGGLGRVAAKLGRARINIDYLYGSTATSADEALIFLKVSDARKAKRLLG